jgi:LDH2 family malate/lactate/ureidoglycolate dehydrogenase
LPEGVVVDEAGRDTTNFDQARALLPLGGRAHGHKGAALASVVEVHSSALSGMMHGNRLIRMDSSDMITPRRLGHFFIVLSPEAFVPIALFNHMIVDYLRDLRSQSTPDKRVLAPGDKEDETAQRRLVEGIPILSSTLQELADLAGRFDLNMPKSLSNGSAARFETREDFANIPT